MATTTNFNWETPDDTDLVKDGAAAIRTALNGVDTSFVDLKGGTTGQVLSKASGTDLDFTWVAQDDSNAIQNAIVDAKGDLIAATAADTPARLAVGTNGQVLIADSTASTGLAWGTVTGGGMTSIASGTLSGSALSLTSISGSYKNLQLFLRDYNCSSGTSMYVSVNGSPTYTYEQLATGNTSGVILQSYSNVGASLGFYLSYDGIAAGDNNNSANLMFSDYTSSAHKNVIMQNSFYSNSGYRQSLMSWGATSLSTAITDINVNLGSGSFSGGTYELFGVK